MRSPRVVLIDPNVNIVLEFIQAPISLLARGCLVKLVPDRLVEAFTDPVGLRMRCFDFAMVDALHGST